MTTASTYPDPTIPSFDQLVADISALDVAIDQQRQLSAHDESTLFAGRCEGEQRKSVILLIALRDEFIDEMLARRSLLIRLMAC